MFQKVLVCGAKRSKGVMDGKPYDSTKVYLQTDMDTSNENLIGFVTEEYKWGLSDNFDKIKDIQTPFEAEAEFQLVNTGRQSRLVLADLKIVDKKAAPQVAPINKV